METVKPNIFANPSGDATNSLELWPTDLDIVASLGLNAYRFSLEWARIEPEEGRFSQAMLDHYGRMIAGCEKRGLKAVVTFNHFSCPRWFAAKGGWANPQAPDLFARFCERAAKAFAGGISHAVTLNEPNLPTLLSWIGLPPQLYAGHAAMLKAAGKAIGSDNFSSGFFLTREEHQPMIPILGAAHRKARAAIKNVRPDLPVGLSLAVSDDQAVGSTTLRDRKRAETYEPWFAFADEDDFIGVQNYDRTRFDANGILPAPADAPRNHMGVEVYAPSLGGAVRYVAKASGKPVFVTEHGVGTNDDALRARFIAEALDGLHSAIDEGVRVLGYMHWSLLDNFEWYGGFAPKLGLVAVDTQTFKRTPKGSALVLGKIAKSNTL
jgi:beta-glucosidase